jgi:hypothetical protein
MPRNKRLQQTAFRRHGTGALGAPPNCHLLKQTAALVCGKITLLAAATAWLKRWRAKMHTAGSFTIRFSEHTPSWRSAHVIQSLQTLGARIEQQEPRLYLVSCERESQVIEVGVSLFHTHFKSLAQVVAVSGLARADASSYHFSKSRAERNWQRG